MTAGGGTSGQLHLGFRLTGGEQRRSEPHLPSEYDFVKLTVDISHYTKVGSSYGPLNSSHRVLSASGLKVPIPTRSETSQLHPTLTVSVIDFIWKASDQKAPHPLPSNHASVIPLPRPPPPAHLPLLSIIFCPSCVCPSPARPSSSV